MFLAVIVLFGVRTVYLELVAYFRNGPLEVQPILNVTGQEWNMPALDVAFREALSSPRLYPITTVPGDREPDRLIEILRPRGTGAEKSGWRDLVRSAYGYAIPTRAFVVEATLRRSATAPHYGVAIRVRHLPLSFVELETVWSMNPERALERAAYSICAFILPYTKACRAAPWFEWQDRRIPPQLFGDYQRAKKMIRERRYDEALQLYHQAVKVDADNVVMRYEMGQLFERLRLYADALATYADLMRDLFPGGAVDRNGLMKLGRVAFPHWWPPGTSGPFDIRYRYVTSLGCSEELVRELCRPDWPILRDALAGEHVEEEERPLRVIEAQDLRRRLGDTLDPWADFVRSHWPDTAGPPPDDTNPPTFSQLVEDGYDERNEDSRRVLAVYLLVCAREEAAWLTEAFHRVIGRRRDTGAWSLTAVACRQIELLIKYKLEAAASRRRQHLGVAAPASTATSEAMDGQRARRRWRAGVEARLDGLARRLDRLEDRNGQPLRGDLPNSVREHADHPARDTKDIAKDLRQIGYHLDSRHWLEHYVSACTYSVPLVDDVEPVADHRPFAECAVKAIEAAERSGDEISFITAKEFWIVAGDPDLVGLRLYDSFRAFESRVYAHPLPAVHDLARYERYAFLLTMLRQGAGAVEERWRQRAKAPRAPAPTDLEEDWRQELHAWQLAVRLGRFYRQWQTRQQVHEAFRNWSELNGQEMTPITYPNVAREWYTPYVNAFAELEQRLVQTEEMLETMGGLGHLEWPDISTRPDDGSLLQNTKAWLQHAQSQSRAAATGEWAESTFADAARARADLWAALRHWAESPGDSAPFLAAITRLPRLPSGHRLPWLT